MILDEREAQYNVHGSYEDVSSLYQLLKGQILDYSNAAVRISELKNGAELLTSIDMICMKLARIAYGDPNHVDNYVDIAGYAELAVKSFSPRSEK